MSTEVKPIPGADIVAAATSWATARNAVCGPFKHGYVRVTKDGKTVGYIAKTKAGTLRVDIPTGKGKYRRVAL